VYSPPFTRQACWTRPAPSAQPFYHSTPRRSTPPARPAPSRRPLHGRYGGRNTVAVIEQLRRRLILPGSRHTSTQKSGNVGHRHHHLFIAAKQVPLAGQGKSRRVSVLACPEHEDTPVGAAWVVESGQTEQAGTLVLRDSLTFFIGPGSWACPLRGSRAPLVIPAPSGSIRRRASRGCGRAFAHLRAGHAASRLGRRIRSDTLTWLPCAGPAHIMCRLRHEERRGAGR